MGGVAEAVLKMAMGNGFGFKYDDALTPADIFGYNYASFIVETDCELDGLLLGEVTADAWGKQGVVQLGVFYEF